MQWRSPTQLAKWLFIAYAVIQAVVLMIFGAIISDYSVGVVFEAAVFAAWLSGPALLAWRLVRRFSTLPAQWTMVACEAAVIISTSWLLSLALQFPDAQDGIAFAILMFAQLLFIGCIFTTLAIVEHIQRRLNRQRLR